MNDIATAIMRLQEAFREHRIEPAIVELSSWEDGQALRHALESSPEFRERVSLGMNPSSGEARNQVEIAGTIVRWPALRRARVGGGFDYI